MVLPELWRPDVTVMPTTADQATAAASQRDAARLAARLAAVRGDLWAESTFTYADLAWTDAAHGPAQMLEEARSAGAHAASLMPGNSGVWLMLADFGSRYKWQTPSPVEALKMSYYTGPHEDTLVPLRLAISARLDPGTDPEFAFLFQRDIENILTYRPALRPAILSAYAEATPQAKQLIEDTAKRLDPAFAQTLHPALNQ